MAFSLRVNVEILGQATLTMKNIVIKIPLPHQGEGR
jgi:hypothetical protein